MDPLSTGDLTGLNAYQSDGSLDPVVIPAPSAGAVLKFTGTPGSPVVTGRITVGELAQSSATSGQIIRWNGTAWAAGNAGGGSFDSASPGPIGGTTPSEGAFTNLTASGTLSFPAGSILLSRLSQSAATSGQVPTWNGAAWVATTPAGGGGSGDVVGPASSVASEIALFDGITGKLIKRATGSGLAKLTSGVLGTATAGTDYQTPQTTLAGYGIADAVPSSRTINGSALTSNITITASPPQAGATINQVLTWSGSIWTPASLTYAALTGAVPTFNQNTTGNAATATALQTARTINGVSFNGTAAITVTAAGSTLSDTVPVSKGGTGLTAFGAALQTLRVNSAGTALEYATPAGGGGGGGDAITTNNLDQFADVTQTGGAILAISASTTLSGGTHSGTNTGDQTAVTGNAATATVLQTARTIGGEAFNGSANIAAIGRIGAILSGPEVTTAATTGRKSWWRVTQAFTLIAGDLSFDCVTAPAGSAALFDIEKNGVSIYSTRPQINAAGISSSAGVVGVITGTTASFAIGDIVGEYIDAIGSGAAGAGYSYNAKIRLT